MDENSLLKNLLPGYLRMEVTAHMTSSLLRRVPFMRNAPSGLYRGLFAVMESSLFAPDDVIVSKGQMNSMLYLLVKGEAVKLEKKGGVLHRYSATHIGHEVFLDKDQATSNVISAVTFCNTFSFSFDQFLRCASCFDEYLQAINRGDMGDDAEESESDEDKEDGDDGMGLDGGGGRGGGGGDDNNKGGGGGAGGVGAIAVGEDLLQQARDLSSRAGTRRGLADIAAETMAEKLKGMPDEEVVYFILCSVLFFASIMQRFFFTHVFLLTALGGEDSVSRLQVHGKYVAERAAKGADAGGSGRPEKES